MLEVRGLSKTFSGKGHDEVKAVNDVSFDVNEGTFMTLLGRSGSGKTTALRCIAGLEQADRGEITIHDVPMFSSTRGINVPAESRPIGLVFQSYAIWPHMSVFENLAFVARRGRKKYRGASVTRVVMEVLDLVGLAGFAERWPTTLSGGQQQRLALARTLITEPKVLLLDEPLSNLDASLRANLRRELKGFAKRLGLTSLYVTHDQAEALSMSDQVGIMFDGRLVQLGTPRELYERPANTAVAEFIGHANLLPVTKVERNGALNVDRRVADTPIGRVSCCVIQGHSYESENLYILIHPEELQISSLEIDRDCNVFEGVVSSVEFYGESEECAIEIGATSLKAKIVPADSSLLPGQHVWLHLPAQRCPMVSGIKS